MANRSYLYLTNDDRSKQNNKAKINITGISKFNYDFPLSYRILVGCDTKLAYSAVFDNEEKIAIQGDFKQGRAELFKFFDELLTCKVFAELEEQIQETKAFLFKCDFKYSLLEPAEVFAMDNEDIYEQNQDFFESLRREIEDDKWALKSLIKDFNELDLQIYKIENSFLGKIFTKSINNKIKKLEEEKEEIKQDILSACGFDYWADVSNENMDATIHCFYTKEDEKENG